MDGNFDQNEHGIWCPSCGDLLVAGWHMSGDDWEEPTECKVCGYPDDLEAMAEYHCPTS